ncbi:MAG: hypothetical protein ACRDHK_07520, partial [Actinomycetota bacterium]
GRFAAWVALAPGTMQFTALAADEYGRSGEGAVTVTVAPDLDDDRAPRPDVSPTQGFAPLTVTFGGGAAADPAVDLLDLDVDGDGQPDYHLADFATPPHQVTHTYVTDGLYLTSLVTREGATGRTITSRVPIHVMPLPDLATSWSAFRDALGRGDVDGALWFVALAARTRYQRVLEDLRPDLPAVAAALQDLTVLVVTPDYATASTLRTRNGTAEPFLVSFVRDADGIWRIASF